MNKLRLKIIAFCIFLNTTFAAINDSQSTDYNNEEFKKRTAVGFFFSMPKTLLAGRNETVCLTTHFATSSKLVIDLKLKEKHYFTTRTLSSEHTCFEMNVPSRHLKEPQLASVRVQVQLNGMVYSAHSQDPIVIYPSKKITFIETDRGLYKSGDKIKFRILTLGDNLLPLKHYKVPFVRVKNPIDITAFVWENVTTEFGLAQLEYQLPKDSIEGKWKIEADDETKPVEVTRYILPRFNVQIINPKIIYHKTPSTTITICSQYSFGATVKGTAFIRLTDSHNNMKPLEAINKLNPNGCADFHFTNDQLSLEKITKFYSHIDPKITIQITATVTEYGTDKIELAKAKSHISLKPFSLKFVSGDVFRPGLPYQGKLQITNLNSNVIGEVIEICYNVAIKKSWNYLSNEQCRNFTVDSSNEVNFEIFPLKPNVIHMHLNARSINHSLIADSLVAIRLYSASSSYIVLDQIHPEKSKCRTNQQFLVQFTTDKFQERDNITFYYIIKSRSQLHKLRKTTHNIRKNYPTDSNLKIPIGIKHKYVKNTPAIDHFIVKFKLDERIVSSYQLLIYYISPNGEIVAATKNVELETCLNNFVEANWSHKEITPGGKATLSVQTSSPSLCAISAVDKSVKFINRNRNLDKEVLYKTVLKDREVPESGRKTCVPPVKKNKNVGALTESEGVWDLRKRRRRRYVHSYSEDFDANDIFNRFGTITITNYHTVTKQCYTGPIEPPVLPVQFLTDQYDNQNEEKIAPIRSYFPETWLWELVLVKGTSRIYRDLPHTITNWVTDIVCVSESQGVGFANTLEISTFQPFFIDVLTPHSIKRNEILYLHVMIFNYLEHDLPVQITLKDSDNYDLVDLLNRKTVSFCISNKSTTTHIFEIKPKNLGEINLTVLGEVDGSYPGQCGPDVVINKRDVVSKTILVESEGYVKHITKSALLCVSDNNKSNVSWHLQVPENVIPETTKAKLILNGDLLGQTIENLDELLMMPTGCGEQIMASLAPNLYVLQYLNVTHSLTNTIRTKSIRNLKMGYQRILNYAHKDGSFSAFGYHDPMGSMFLTAFVVRTLRQAKEYIYIDQKVIDRAVAWIFEHQLENGCFSTMLHVFQDMGGTSTQNSTAGLTAYVIVSLLEAGIEIPENIKTNAKYCIRGYYNLDKYTLAISSYALLKVNWYEEATRMLKRLTQIANHKDDMMWWTVKETDGSVASDVETTSYVLLALLHYRTQENLAYAHSIVRWLSTKLSDKGGFKSTQDTVVALSALTKYSQFISRQMDLNVSISSIGLNYKFSIRDEDRMKSKKIILKEPNTQINILVEGDGCVLAQAVLTYYIKHIQQGDAFRLDVEASSVSTVDKCSIAMLAPCFKYNGPDATTNMAILEVGLPSGYIADRASLYKLVDDANVKMFDEIDQKVVFYLTKLSHEQVCINFKINENTIVQGRVESTMKLYDYYKPEYSVLQFYKLNDCKLDQLTSAVIPDLVVNQSESGKNVVKRGIDKGFKNVDFELDFPDGIEENQPSYVKPNFTINLNVNNSIDYLSSKKIEKRSLNPSFVDRNYDLEMVEGKKGQELIGQKTNKTRS